ALDRLDPVACYLEFSGNRIPGIPAFDAPATGIDGAIGTLGVLGERDRAIRVAELTPQSVYTGEYHALRREEAYRALVIVCAVAHPGLGLLNAEGFRHPFGAPAIHVASEARELVLQGAAGGSIARVVANNRYTSATACSVVVTLRGHHPASPPAVVM